MRSWATGSASGVTLQCQCKAGVHSRACWHVGLVLMALDGEVEIKKPTPIKRPASLPTPAELANRASA